MSLIEKIRNSEDTTQKLIAMRHKQILTLFEKTKTLDIDDATLAGALIYIKEKSSPEMIAKFKELAESYKIKIPSRSHKSKEPA